MEEIIKKIETYNIVNYLIPGIIFTVLFSYLTGITFLNNNFGIALVEYYFIGLVISRIGSIIIKPILKICRIIDEEEYSKFINKESKDEKIPLLVRDANQYRTFIATFAILTGIEFYNILNKIYDKWNIVFILLGLTVLFIFSYRKQIGIISQRVKNK